MFAITDLSNAEIHGILKESEEFANGKIEKVVGQCFCSNLFFENSTRTKTSFEVAERKLGLEVVPFDPKTSSVNKGESLHDTVKTLESIGINIMVIRHGEDRFYTGLNDVNVPLINAGDGTGKHPTQSFLDLLTIYQEFGKFEGLKVGIVGDIKHSRVANSDAEALRRLGAKVYLSGPEEWFQLGTIINGTFLPFDELVKEVDVVMMLRIQHERHPGQMHQTLEDYHTKYGLTKTRAAKMKPGAIIMHPAPVNRGVEIDGALVESSQSRIFKQMKNGVYARMAVLKTELQKSGFKFEKA